MIKITRTITITDDQIGVFRKTCQLAEERILAERQKSETTMEMLGKMDMTIQELEALTRFMTWGSDL